MRNQAPRTIRIGKQLLDLSKAHVMGIINVTPDSFYDGGQTLGLEGALKQAGEMLSAGASIIDVGGATSRPGSENPGADTEINRVVPVIDAIRSHYPEAILSVDTYHSAVAEAAVNAGAHMVNDISGGGFDELMLSTVARLGAPYIMMHMQGTPADMQHNPSYEHVVTEVTARLSTRVEQARSAGIRDIIIDPGFGFGKTDSHNYALLRELNHLSIIGVPILVGLSRKSMIQRVLNVSASQSLNGTTALHMAALERGAHILRVHDVKEALECITLFERLTADDEG